MSGVLAAGGMHCGAPGGVRGLRLLVTSQKVGRAQIGGCEIIRGLNIFFIYVNIGYFSFSPFKFFF